MSTLLIRVCFKTPLGLIKIKGPNGRGGRGQAGSHLREAGGRELRPLQLRERTEPRDGDCRREH